MKRYTINFKMNFNNLDVESFKYGLQFAGYTLAESSGGDTIIRFGKISFAYIRETEKKLEVRGVWMGDIKNAYLYGLLTRYANRSRLRCESHCWGTPLHGELTDLRTDGVRIPFTITDEGKLIITTDSKNAARCGKIVMALCKFIPIRPDVEILRDIEVNI